MPFAIGENVGPYRVIEQLGQGGLATVYKAYHAALDRYVAIKVLHPAFLEDVTFHQRFDREAKVIARLEHPNIVPIYDYAEHNGQPYLVMKFIEGETLKARLARGPLTIDEMSRTVEAVGEALSYAHKQRVLHRDIKPSNILLAPDGHIYLADFGLARMAQSGASTLSSDMMLGTPHYISPEQARGERDLDEATDIYSLGVVLYEVVVGRVPFSADTPFSIIHDHIYTPLPLPRNINPRIPEAVQLVLLKALDKDRKARFATVEDLATAFRNALISSTSAAVPGKPDLGTLAIAPPSTRPAPATESRAPVGVGAPLPAAPETASPPPMIQPARKRSLTWIWAAGGLAITCVCLFAFVLVANQGAGESTSTVAPTSGVVVPPGREATPGPDLEAALATVEAHPNDPQARQVLAAAYLGQGDGPSAYRELTKAGGMYLASGDYLQAAAAFARALDVVGGPEQAAPDLVDGLIHSLFFGVESEATRPLVDQLTASYPDWDALLPVRARAMLLRNEIASARRLVIQSLAGKPDDPVPNAVLAELRLKSEDPQGARVVAERTLSNPTTPVWLRPFLDQIIQATHAP